MIINLTGSVKHTDGFELDFDLTPVYFDKGHSVRVNEIFVLYNKAVGEINGVLTSTLIDKSSLNPLQQLLFYHHYENKKFFHYTPTQPATYKIQNTEPQTSVFTLKLFRADRIKQFVDDKFHPEQVYLQLEITFDAGI